MSNLFFEKPILNSPYELPTKHWELDKGGQPTHLIIPERRKSDFITPIPKPKKRHQTELVLDEGQGLSGDTQAYHAALINEVRRAVDKWRQEKDSNKWLVTPETARLLKHWRHYPFNGVRPFFCQVEAVETAIWLTEVA